MIPIRSRLFRCNVTMLYGKPMHFHSYDEYISNTVDDHLTACDFVVGQSNREISKCLRRIIS